VDILVYVGTLHDHQCRHCGSHKQDPLRLDSLSASHLNLLPSSMDQLVSTLLLISALVSALSGVNGLPSLPRDGKTKHSFQEIVVFGDSVSDNGLSNAVLSLNV
jgi:hypothetical protein